jgi:hypothetical protein
MAFKRVVFARYLPVINSGFGWDSIVVYLHTDGALTEGTAKHPWQRNHALIKHALLRAYESQEEEDKRIIDMILEEAL